MDELFVDPIQRSNLHSFAGYTSTVLMDWMDWYHFHFQSCSNITGGNLQLAYLIQKDF